MRQPVQVAVYAVRQNDAGWEYLLLRRIPSGGGIWQGVTGGVEGTEDSLAAAVRELKEETGYDPAEMHVIDYSYHFPVLPSMRKLYDNDVATITELVFVAVIDTAADPVIDPVEHDGWKWCDYDTAQRLLCWSGNRASLKHCRRFLRNDKKTSFADG